jgi:putative NIF3 family GTP cyclohydrolase 1 type 2
MEISRRSFLHTSAGLAVAGMARPHVVRAQATLTVADVIQRIKDKVGIPWRAQTVDNLVAGRADVRIRGIATTMMATLDVVQRASAAGLNLVISHEPTFYTHQDTTDTLKADATYQFKEAFIRDHDMAVFHFHDHWHGMKPDGIAFGMARELGWDKNVDPANPREFTFNGVPLEEFVSRMRDRLAPSTMRVVGDPKMAVNRVAASWGYYTYNPANLPLTRPDVDVFVVGETREWETVEHAQDMNASGRKKALVVIGHVASEQAGMKYCAEWLKGFVTEVPIAFVPASEPFWK